MTIENAERFGLAQLHQLRGRISRGQYPGYCGLMSDARNEQATARLEALLACDDGFKLAEIDLEMRGAGELLGSRQHGLASMRIADLARDGELLVEARTDAMAMIESDGDLSRPEHAALRRMTIVRYGRSLDLGAIG
jgi:ATP-dependent DNA helicase RecG